MKPTVRVRILGISGTPVLGGNCDKLTKEVLKTIAQGGNVDTDFVTLADKEVAMCRHCQYCIEHKSPCRIKDDANEILDKMEKVDGFVFVSPTWGRTLSPPLLLLFSRARSRAFFTQSLRNKVAGFVTLGFLGVGFDDSLNTMAGLTYGHGIIPVAKGSVMTSTVVRGEPAGYLEHGVFDDKRGLHFAKVVGKRVVEVARMIRYATDAGIILEEYPNLATGATMKAPE